MGLWRFVKIFSKTTYHLVFRDSVVLCYDDDKGKFIEPAPPFRLSANIDWNSVETAIAKLSNASVPASAREELKNFVDECKNNWDEADKDMTELTRVFRFVWREHAANIHLESSWTHGFMHFDSSWVKSKLEHLKGLRTQMKKSVYKGKGQKLLKKVKQTPEFENLNEALVKVYKGYMQQLSVFVLDVKYLTKSLNCLSAEHSAHTYKCEWQGITCGLVFFLLAALLTTLTPIFEKLLKEASIPYTVILGASTLILILMLIFPVFKYLSPWNWLCLLRWAHRAHYSRTIEFYGKEIFLETMPRTYILPLQEQSTDMIDNVRTNWKDGVRSLEAGFPFCKKWKILEEALSLAEKACEESEYQSQCLSQHTTFFKTCLDDKSTTKLKVAANYIPLSCTMIDKCETFDRNLTQKIQEARPSHKPIYEQLRTNFKKIPAHLKEHCEKVKLYEKDLLRVSNYYIKKSQISRMVIGSIGVGLAFVLAAGAELMAQIVMENPWKHVPFRALMGVGCGFYALALFAVIFLLICEFRTSAAKQRMILGFYYS